MFTFQLGTWYACCFFAEPCINISEFRNVLYCLSVQRVPINASRNLSHQEVTYAGKHECGSRAWARWSPPGGRLPIIAPRNGFVSAPRQSH